MRFGPDASEAEYLSVLNDFLARECASDLVRAVAAREDAYRERFWASVANVGVLGLTAPSDDGGTDAGVDTLIVVFEELGRSAAPGPLIETAAVAPPLLAALAEPGLAADVFSGRVTVTVSLGFDTHVTFAGSADLVLLLHGRTLHAVPRANLELRRQPSLDPATPLYAVEWKPSASLAAVDAGTAIELAFDRGALATAAFLVGLSDRVLARSVEYTTLRRQFGRPVGSFQAVQHPLVNAYVDMEVARSLVRYAAAVFAGEGAISDLPAPVLASMAKIAAIRASRRAAASALQSHGAMGYSFEYELRLWLSRVWALASAWGDLGFHRRRVAVHYRLRRP